MTIKKKSISSSSNKIECISEWLEQLLDCTSTLQQKPSDRELVFTEDEIFKTKKPRQIRAHLHETSIIQLLFTMTT